MSALGLAFVAAALAGFSRGFAAFGAAMIYIPLVTLAYDAKTAVVTLLLVDLPTSLPLIWKAAPRSDRHALGWMALGAIGLTPIGVTLLVVADQKQIQLAMGAILMAAAFWLLLNRRFRLSQTPAMSIVAGAISGLAGGLCGIFGPPAMIYLIGRSADSRSSRADMMVFLTGESIVLGITYLAYGMYSRALLELSAMLMPVYGLCIWLGARSFYRTGEAAYRRAVLGMLIAISALLILKSLPRLFA